MANYDETRSGTRCRNFTEVEDVLICLAWSNVGNDELFDIDQNASTFWGKAHAYWLKHKDEDHPIRTPDALMQRFSRIKTSVVRFCGYLSQVESLSDLTEVEKIHRAKQMYSEGESKGDVKKNGTVRKEKFKFEHCWNVLRNDQKWLQVTNEKPKGSEVPNFNVVVPHNDIPHNDNVDDGSFPIDVEELPTREKPRKEGKTKRKRKFGYDNSSLLGRMDQFWKMNEKISSENEVMFIEHDKKLDKLLELKREKLELEKKKLEMTEKRNDFDLMMVDASSFTDPIQIQFFQRIRKDIMKKYLNSE